MSYFALSSHLTIGSIPLLQDASPAIPPDVAAHLAVGVIPPNTAVHSVTGVVLPEGSPADLPIGTVAGHLDNTTLRLGNAVLDTAGLQSNINIISKLFMAKIWYPLKHTSCLSLYI